MEMALSLNQTLLLLLKEESEFEDKLDNFELAQVKVLQESALLGQHKIHKSKKSFWRTNL